MHRLILTHDKKVIKACLSCLGSIVNDVTKNFQLIRDCYKKYYYFMTMYKKAYSANPDDPRLEQPQTISKFRRGLYTVGLLLMYFDFGSPELYLGLEVRQVIFYSIHTQRRSLTYVQGLFFNNILRNLRKFWKP